MASTEKVKPHSLPNSNGITNKRSYHQCNSMWQFSTRKQVIRYKSRTYSINILNLTVDFVRPGPITIQMFLIKLNQNGINTTNNPESPPTILDDNYKKYLPGTVDQNNLSTSTSAPTPCLRHNNPIGYINIIKITPKIWRSKQCNLYKPLGYTNYINEGVSDFS